MFNLIICNSLSEGYHSFPASRIYRGDRSTPLAVTELELRSHLPTIVMDEGAPLTDENARFVRLRDFKLDHKEIGFELQDDRSAGNFPAEFLERYKTKHSLSDAYNWHHTCWQYAVGDIFQTLYSHRKREASRNEPNIFHLNNPTVIDSTKVACMMPFKPEFDDVYTSISAACAKVGLSSLRVDEIYGTGPIINDIVQAIDTAAVVVCDLSGRNPNVLYETGIAHAIGRRVVILAQDVSSDVPFDLKHMRCIPYNGTNQFGRDQLRDHLSKTLESVI